MSILSLDDYIAATKKEVQFTKTGAVSATAGGWTSVFSAAGSPGGVGLSPGNTANGIVPTELSPGYPRLSLGGLNDAYLSRVEFGSTVPCRIALFDRIFVAGPYAFNANTTLSSQPSYASRLPYKPDGVTKDYDGLEIWVEQVTAATGNQAVNVSYTIFDPLSQTEKTRLSGAVGIGSAPLIARCWRIPIIDYSSVMKINAVTGSVASAGTFNVMILRRLWTGRVSVANGGDVHDMLRTGLVKIPPDAALYAMICPDSTSTGIPDLSIQVAAN